MYAAPDAARTSLGADFEVPAELSREPAGRVVRQPSRDAIRRACLLVADAAAAAVAVAVVGGEFGSAHIAPVLVAPIMLVLLCKLAGLYDDDELRLVGSTIDEIPTLLKLSGLVALGISIATPALTGGQVRGSEAAALWITLVVVLICGRALGRVVADRASPVERCLVIGDLALADRLRDCLQAERAAAIVVGALPVSGPDLAELVQPGGEVAIRVLVRDLAISRIIIALGETVDDEVAELLRLVRAAGVRASIAPKTFSGIGDRFASEEVNGLWLIGIAPFGLSSASRLVKRYFDVLVVGIALVVIAPVMALIGLAIKLDSHGPVFFSQIRVGQDGKRFRMFKFRSMVTDAESLKEDLRQLSEVGDGMFKIAEDPRVTRVGRVLRRSSLDELPQLWNVLRGEMSLVGPRPLVVDEDAAIFGVDRSRLHLPPGMTGPWQVLRRRVAREDMVEIDYRYTASWTLWSDVRILLRTFLHVVRQGNH
jgi:exopolysaccharide biosynthesis polyprenyl glycosylphosphotransferase